MPTTTVPQGNAAHRIGRRIALRWLRFRARLRILIRTTRTAPLKVRILVVIVGVYLISPLDIIPNFIPGLGVLDDIVVLGSVCWVLNRWHPPTARALRNLVR